MPPRPRELPPETTPAPDVAAVLTAMTDHEKSYVGEAVRSVLGDPAIGQVILCVEEQNSWIEAVLGESSGDPRLQVLRLPRAPVGTTRNRGVEQVTLPWIAFCDGDDVWCSGKTKAQRATADETGSDFVGADHVLIDEQGRICAFALARYLPMPSSWLVRTDVMRRFPFADRAGPQYEDSQWWHTTTGRIRRTRLPKILLRYRVRSGSESDASVSKRRKTRIVALAQVPGLRPLLLFFTWVLWLAARRKRYIWHRKWRPPPQT